MQCGVATNPKKNANKREKHPRTKRGIGRGPLEVCENGVKKKNRKRRKNPRHRSREAIFESHPKTTEKNDTGAHPPRAKFARAADTLRKIPFSKRARFCSPRGFLTFETQIRQKLEHRTVQNSNTRKKLSSRQVRKMKFFSKLHKGSKRHRDAKWLQNPLFCSVSRVVTSTDVLAKDSRPKLTKKGLPGRVAKKTRKMLPKGPFCQKVNFAIFPSSPQFREKRSPHFAL